MTKFKINQEIIDKFKEVAQLQVELNNKLVPEWRTANLNWQDAILAEAGEFIESTGYKWWKKIKPDWDNMKVEAIDLLHFIIADYLKFAGYENESPLDKKIHVFGYFMGDAFISGKKVPVPEDENIRLGQIKEELHILVSMNYQKDRVKMVYPLTRIFILLGLDENDVYKRYGVKNLLNIYRSERGYNEGKYVKEVCGNEDNVAIAKILQDTHISEKEKIFKKMDAFGYGNGLLDLLQN